MRMPLTLEFYTRVTLCLSRWSSTLVRRYAPHAGVTHLRDTVPLALEFHTRAMPCLRADDGYGLLSSDVQHLL